MKSWTEISRAALTHNLRAIQATAGPGVETLAVIKANGYGHDATLLAQVLAEAGAPWLGVTDADEGMRVRSAVGWTKPRILVMCGSDAADAPTLLEYKLTPVVWTVDHLRALEAVAADAVRSDDVRFRVHLEIDTGMSRQGVLPGDDLQFVLDHLAASQTLLCEGIMTHLACAESCDGTRGSSITERQGAQFHSALRQLKAAGLRPELIHMANTSALDEGATMPWIREVATALGATPMVRTGLAIYGDALPIEGASGSDSGPHLRPQLQPVLSWKTRILDLRDIPGGATVGYGATFTAAAPMRLALLPVGYADGLRREASSGLGNGWVMIAGRRAAVVGRVSMNLSVVDVTGLDAAIGDEVTLLGEGVSADDHARWCETIPYEILCGLRAPARLV